MKPTEDESTEDDSVEDASIEDDEGEAFTQCFFCGYVDLRKKCSSGKLSKFHLKNMIFINEIVKRRARKQKFSPAAL